MIVKLIQALMSATWAKYARQIIKFGSGAIALFIAFTKGKAEGQRKYKEAAEKADRKAADRTRKIKHTLEKASEEEIDKRLEPWIVDG